MFTHSKCQNSSLSSNSVKHTKTVSFQTIQFSIGTQFSSVWYIDRILSGATTPGQSGPGNDSNEGVLRIPQSSSITGTSLSDCLVSYQDIHWVSFTPLQRCSWCILQPQPNGPSGHSLGESYCSILTLDQAVNQEMHLCK